MKRMLVASMGWAVALAIAAPACSAEDIVLAKLPAGSEDGHGSEGRKCVESSECSGRGYCSKRECTDLGGECELRPVVCENDLAPVCGCDGITYWNDCLRRQAGASIMNKGECVQNPRFCGGALQGPPKTPDEPPVPGPDPSGPPCPTGTFCARLSLPSPPAPGPQPPGCAGDVPGTCWALPVECPPNAGPIGWIECGPAPGCVSMCKAIRSEIPHVQSIQCP